MCFCFQFSRTTPGTYISAAATATATVVFFFLACVSAIFVKGGSNPWKIVFGGGIW